MWIIFNESRLQVKLTVNNKVKLKDVDMYKIYNYIFFTSKL